MSKGVFSLRMLGVASSRRLDKIGARLAALEGEVRAHAERAQTACEEIRELRVRSDQDAAEIARLKSAVVRLEHQLQWVTEEGQKTAAALVARFEAFRKT